MMRDTQYGLFDMGHGMLHELEVLTEIHDMVPADGAVVYYDIYSCAQIMSSLDKELTV
jgi:hypothetical protein